ncbi:hypothetical protein ACQ4PT_043910 [Festuca glaucescens]
MVMGQFGGKLLVFQSTLPSLGIGRLRLRGDDVCAYGTDKEHILRVPEDTFYKQMAAEFTKNQIAVDIFSLSGQYCDVASLSSLAKYTGGQVYHYPSFHATTHRDKLKHELSRNLTRETAWESVMRIRCGKGVRFTTYHGHFMLRTTDLLALPAVDSDKAFAMQLSLEETLMTTQTVYFQVALLYTSSSGERRIRVHTAAAPVVTDLGEMYRQADTGAIVSLLARISVENSLSDKLDSVRQQLQLKLVRSLKEYRNLYVVQHRIGGRLIYPESLRYLPLYILALCKSLALRGGYADVSLDERCAAGFSMMILPAKRLLNFIYPSLYRLDEVLTMEPDRIDGSLRRLPLTLQCLDSAGLYLLDDGFTFLVWLGRMLQPELVNDVFGVSLANFPDLSKGLGLLTLSSMFPSPGSQQCDISADSRSECPSSSLQTAFFYVSLYLVAIAQSGHKPCVQAFGADQFDATDPIESSSRSSFFNWWYFGVSASATVAVAVMSYVQDNVSWGLGFGVPCIIMLLALIVFLLGTRTYRFYDSSPGKDGSVFLRAGKVFRAWRKRSPEGGALVEHGEYAENAVLAEEVRGLARLFPIWAACLLYGVVFAQSPTLFTKQAATLDRRVGSSLFQIPPAAMQCFLGVSIIICVVLYDRVLVPVARRITGVASGITMLQRIGTGMALALAALVVATLMEMRRLRAARDAGVVDVPEAVVPMSLWWMVPQYVLLGAADVFTLVGMQEFFYDQMPGELKSLGLALYLSVLGVGSFISSFLISVIDGVTSRDGGTSWFADNLNRGHLDYFYLLLAALTALELVAYLYFSATYVYKRKPVNVH